MNFNTISLQQPNVIFKEQFKFNDKKKLELMNTNCICHHNSLFLLRLEI